MKKALSRDRAFCLSTAPYWVVELPVSVGGGGAAGALAGWSPVVAATLAGGLGAAGALAVAACVSVELAVEAVEDGVGSGAGAEIEADPPIDVLDSLERAARFDELFVSLAAER